MTTTFTSRQFNQDTGGAKRAAEDGPVYITDRGRPTHVLLTIRDYDAFVGSESLVDLLSRTPGVGELEFEVPRIDDVGRAAAFD
jgi:prevent-host-death family protein